MFVIRVAGLLVAALIPLGKSDIQHPDKYTAKFASNLHDYHITVPSLLSNQDRFVSNSDDKAQLDLSFISEKVLHLEVPAFGRKLRLLLRKSTKFLSPGLVIEREDNVRQHNLDCHYAGQIKDQPNSLVSISNCQGLKGLIQTEDGERYFIEPAQRHNTSDAQNAHILYKRSITDPLLPWKQENQLCADQETITLKRRLRSPYLEMRSKRHGRRGRRSVSTERNVEILMVADKTMYEFYKDGLEEYLLTIANMVSSIYRDPSIGTAVNIVLVRVVILKENPSSLKVTHHAGNTLNSFCRWASLINPKSEGHPNHHDVAVLITRHDICRGINEPCETLGLSQVNGLCTKDKSCNINEDSGLTLAYTIAHEIGHNLGMLHDGDENTCKWNHDKPFLMSPLLQASGRQQLWSPCSRNYLRRFLNKGWGWCLNDEPSKHDFKFPTMLPGVIYDADHQCRLQYGALSSHCAGMTDICNRLWCRLGKACHSKLEPAADGTKCGDNKWCYKGGCIERGKIPTSVDGGWGSWWNFSECSRTCGGGVSFSERHCNNPRPAHGGKYCTGEWKKYKLCNTHSCPAGSVGYRDLQCSKFDGKLLRNRRWEWKPRYSPVSPCELHCTPKGHFGLYFSKKFSDQVHDGTPCFPGKRDVCINGKCENVGCDNVLHSNAREDKCGVCRGDGTSCETVKSTFDQKTGIGYVETKVIPSGARNIRVEEVAGAPNYLALRSKSGKWYLNGDWYIQQSGEYPAGGTTVFYTRKHNKETFVAVGPTTDDLHIMLLFQTRNPGINFEYTIPKNQTVTQKLVFNWHSRDWTPCSATCGVGTTRSEVECVEEGGTPVDDKYCKSIVRPDDRQKTCNEDPCPPTWWHGSWQPCSKTCGNGISIRSVLCVRSNGKDEQMALKDEHCAFKEKPLLVRSCFKAACPLQWTVGSWSKCTMSCGRGIKKRKVSCEARNPDEKCDSKAVPISWAYCGISSCPPVPTVKLQTTGRLLSTFKLRDGKKVNSTREDVKIPKYKIEKHCTEKLCRPWNVGNWSKCSTTCDQGIQVRNVYCAGSQPLCDRRTKPSKIRICTMRPCAEWRTGPWTQCSATCGDGMRKRIVTCSNIKTRLTSKDCDLADKPDHYQNCHVEKCPEQSRAESDIQQKPTQESFSSCVEKGRDIYFCKLVVLHKFCQFELWRERCCKTCTQIKS